MRTEDVAVILEDIVGARRVLKRPSELVVYSADGLPSYRKQPALAVFPETREELVDIVRALAAIATPLFIASGIVPAALEMMDAATVRAVEASIYAAGYPTDAEAVLLAEVDGLLAGVDADARVIDQ